MKQVYVTFLISILILAGCKSRPELVKEQWIDKPVNEWPDFALTNEIAFNDTTYQSIANSFLVDTGRDTIAVSCKHVFLVFSKHLGINTINLDKKLKYWSLYPKNKLNKVTKTKEMINENRNEQVGEFNTLKNRDWLIFHIEGEIKDAYPLKIRYTPLESNEIVYAVGWGANQEEKYPTKIKLQCYKDMGNYYYIRTLTKGITPSGRSGSPVIDSKGYLVGIVSGAEGNLGIIGSVAYLKYLFDSYGIKYEMID